MMNTLHRHCHPNPDYHSHAPASENSVDIAAPIVSALQAPPTKAQVMVMVVMVMVMVLMIMMVMMVMMVPTCDFWPRGVGQGRDCNLLIIQDVLQAVGSPRDHNHEAEGAATLLIYIMSVRSFIMA